MNLIERHIYRYCGKTSEIKHLLKDYERDIRMINNTLTLKQQIDYFKWAVCQTHYPVCFPIANGEYGISLPCRDMIMQIKNNAPIFVVTLQYWLQIRKQCVIDKMPSYNMFSWQLNESSYPVANIKRIEDCQRTLFQPKESKDKQKNCYEGKGVYYNGSINTDENGKKCVQWKSIYTLRTPMYLQLTENHCRNPQGFGDRPWCYTDIASRDWGYCSILKCGEVNNDSEKLSTVQICFIAIAVILGSVFVFLMLYIVKMKWKRSNLSLRSLTLRLLPEEQIEEIEPAYITFLDQESLPNILCHVDE